MMTQSRSRVGVALALMVVVAAAIAPLTAQQRSPAQIQQVQVTGDSPAPPDTYGPVGNIIYNLGPDDFSVQIANWSSAFMVDNSAMINNGAGLLRLSAPLHLPNGALVTSIVVFYTDASAVTDPSAALLGSGTTGGVSVLLPIPFIVFSGGNLNTSAVPATPIQIDNATFHYAVVVNLPSTSTIQLFRVRVNYRLQVSPAPGTATFADVPVGNPYHQFIEGLVASGITGGCGGGNYCPDAPVTRAQMAVFLAAALGLHWPN